MVNVLYGGFLAQAERQPDEVALIWPDVSMTYGELARRTGQLAGRLRTLGVESNTAVGVSVPQGWRQVVAVSGVQMAGGAMSWERERGQIKRLLRVLKVDESVGESVVSRLRMFMNILNSESGNKSESGNQIDSDLAEATADDILELVDRELGEG